MAKKRILLVPVDGSDCALRALAHACRRFKAGGYAAVVVLHAQLPIAASRYVTAAMIREHHARLTERVLAPARRVAARMRVPLRCVVAIAEPASAIVAAVKASHGDEIVMGTRGSGRLSKLLLGSTALKVVQLASVPVTLVK